MNTRGKAAPAASVPTIATPGSGVPFEEWMPAANVFDAFARSRQQWGDRAALAFLGSDPDAPART
ncbi:MAG TPA: hypothetical protein VIL30_10355, partial [Ramlibacter sp.]